MKNASCSSGCSARPSRNFVGSGKAEEIAGAGREHQAELILVDHPLSPSQQRNLEHLSGLRVLDRNALILDIFAQRARSFEGKLEVELAQLRHMASRLVRGWTHLERQKGGIGLRGPGELRMDAGGHPDLILRCADGGDGVAEALAASVGGRRP